jgi:hypothetical protein
LNATTTLSDETSIPSFAFGKVRGCDILNVKETILPENSFSHLSIILNHIEHVFSLRKMFFTVYTIVSISALHHGDRSSSPLVEYDACSKTKGLYPAVRSPSKPNEVKLSSDSITHSAEFKHNGVVWLA